MGAPVPRLGIAVWQVLSTSVVLAVVLGGMAVTIPILHLGDGITGFLDACATAIQAQYDSPGGTAIGVAGGALALATLSRVLYCLARRVGGPVPPLTPTA